MPSEMRPLGDFVTLVSGSTPSKSNPDFWGGTTPWVSAKDMADFWIEDAEDHLTDAGVAEASRLVPEGTVLLLTRGMTLHKRVPICRIMRPSTFNQDVKAVLPKSGLSPRFLPYLLVGNHARLHEQVDSAGHGTGRLNSDALLAFPVRVPEQSQQDQIADIGEVLDAQLLILRQNNATLESIAQALFKSWFIDFDPVRAKAEGREPEGMDTATSALFPVQFSDTGLGLAPTGWPVHCVEEVAERVGMGPFGSNIKVETFVDSGIPVLNGANVQGALLGDTEFRFVTKEHAARLHSSCVRAGDIVLTHRGTLGQVSLVPGESQYTQYVLSQSQFFLRCSPSVMAPEWMLYFLRSEPGQHLLLANASQVGVPSIARPSSYLRSMRLVVPPPSVVNRFAETIRPLHAAIVANREQVQSLGAIRDALLPRLVSGELRLPECQKELRELVA